MDEKFVYNFVEMWLIIYALNSISNVKSHQQFVASIEKIVKTNVYVYWKWNIPNHILIEFSGQINTISVYSLELFI